MTDTFPDEKLISRLFLPYRRFNQRDYSRRQLFAMKRYRYAMCRY